ncbi:c-type cytochrome [Sphingomonas crocodyli]|uniref:Cytochrome C n=1 Tax=Sphingomonas crocodyli TaxID=1979270 RepID=A0A437M9N6_9SPHN|nr:cytochrome c [Sphingomonas crocodyli]RVT94392.1 cytochrome C [Sphingomonas crocodyli]
MTTKIFRRLALGFAVLAALTAPAQADEPGGGGTKAPVPVTGEQVYKIVCAACHMQDAKGGSGAATIPALAGNPKLGVAAYPITIVVRGKGAMPSFADTLKPAQIAGVVAYVRTHFGNDFAKPVTEEEVARMMPKTISTPSH